MSQLSPELKPGTPEFQGSDQSGEEKQPASLERMKALQQKLAQERSAFIPDKDAISREDHIAALGLREKILGIEDEDQARDRLTAEYANNPLTGRKILEALSAITYDDGFSIASPEQRARYEQSLAQVEKMKRARPEVLLADKLSEVQKEEVEALLHMPQVEYFMEEVSKLEAIGHETAFYNNQNAKQAKASYKERRESGRPTTAEEYRHYVVEPGMARKTADVRAEIKAKMAEAQGELPDTLAGMANEIALSVERLNQYATGYKQEGPKDVSFLSEKTAEEIRRLSDLYDRYGQMEAGIQTSAIKRFKDKVKTIWNRE